MNVSQSKAFFLGCEAIFAAELDHISALDAAIGDGDHGVSMLKGFRAVKEVLDSKEFSDIGSMWMEAGKVIMSQIGGTCGPLFATIFMKGGMLARGKDTVDAALLSKMITLGSDGVMALGKANVGEKTMVDALKPAADALAAAVESGLGEYDALCKAVDAAHAGMEATADMLATKGRGRYQGENARGHIDAGACSVTLIFCQLAEAVK